MNAIHGSGTKKATQELGRIEGRRAFRTASIGPSEKGSQLLKQLESYSKALEIQLQAIRHAIDAVRRH